MIRAVMESERGDKMTSTSHVQPERVATGVAGLDEILGGGFPRGLIYLIEGDPGTGKTTLGLQFLLEGARRGEPGLFVSLSSPREELERIVFAHGWTLEG